MDERLKRRKRIYLSGPIAASSQEALNANLQRFVDVGEKLAKENPENLPFTPQNHVEIGRRLGWEWKDYMKADLHWVEVADEVYMLKGWKGSRGARMEHWLAKRLGKEITYEDENEKG